MRVPASPIAVLFSATMLAASMGAMYAQAEQAPAPATSADGAAVADEYRAGSCKRPMKMRRHNALGYSYVCAGNTIRTQGDHGQWDSYVMYDCPDGFQPVRDADGRGKTCVRRAPRPAVASADAGAAAESSAPPAQTGSKLKINLRKAPSAGQSATE